MEVSELTLQEFGAPRALMEGEEVLGFYRGSEFKDSFLITDQSLYLSRDGSIAKITYSDMESCSIPAGEESQAGEVWVRLKSDDVVKILVEGGEGKYRDAFPFATFIKHVIAYR